MNQYILSHNDLDGLASVFVAKQEFPDIQYIATGYDNFEENLKKINMSRTDLLIISDVWGEAAALNKYEGKGLYVFDHHKTSQDDQDLFRGKAVVCNETRSCSAKQMADYFGIKFPAIELVNEYDTTGTIEGDAGKLNILFWERKHKYMFEVFGRKPFYFTEDEEATLEYIEEQCKSYFDSCPVTVFNMNGNEVAFVDAVDHIHYVTKKLLKSYDTAILYNSGTNTVSIRSNKPYARPIAEKLGGGGHDMAAGVSYLPPKCKLTKAAQEFFDEID